MVFPASGEKTWMISTACVVEGILSLFSSQPKRDRDLLHSKEMADRERSMLPQDSSPLRDLYIENKDESIWKIILNFLDLVKAIFWDKALPASFICKTIGVQALFDVFRVVALRTPIEDLEPELATVLKSASSIDFGDQFFQASGKGRVRVKNVILYAANLITESDLPTADRNNYTAILATLKKY